MDKVSSPDIVKDSPNVPKYHSSFPLKEVRLSCELFGLIKPHFVIDDISSDDFEYRPVYRSRSYTLRAPLMQDVHRKLSYIKVDGPAILPLNFEKFYTNPVIGDDVPADVNTVVENGYKRIFDAVESCLNASSSALTAGFTTSTLTQFFKALVFGELFYSRGSLLSSLGCKISKQIRLSLNSIYYSYDGFFDKVCSSAIQFMINNGVGAFRARFGSTIKVITLVVDVSGFTPYDGLESISFREFLSEIRSSSDWEIVSFGVIPDVPVSATFDLSSLDIVGSFPADAPFNYGRLCAYQLAVAEYFTNDKVDHIYSAELYRQYIFSLCASFGNDLGISIPRYFAYNGVNYQYDFLSGVYMVVLLDSLIEDPSVLSRNDCNEYFISIFGMKRSLRYKDYFVSSRVRPLAVGDVSVSVDSNAVSVIDVSRKIQVQRFLNAVNHTGRRLSNYIKTFFGISIPADRHVPHWLADIDEMVYTSETENTAEAQQTKANSVTATFSGNSSNKQLHFYADFPGYIIGLTSYDIERAYIDTIDRSFFIRDRFDMFIPEMQFVGDQPVYVHELNCADARPFGTAFGYQYRDMQYKLLYSVADAGFVENLPGYAFLYNPALWQGTNISPDFIRSRPSELDGFYLSLTGYSLGSYFHFISVVTNNVFAKRPMIANPKILE